MAGDSLKMWFLSHWTFFNYNTEPRHNFIIERYLGGHLELNPYLRKGEKCRDKYLAQG